MDRKVPGLVMMVALALLVVPMISQAQQKNAIELKSVAEVEVIGKNAQGE